MSIIRGSKVYLRQPIIEDAKLWTKWLNDYDIILPLGDVVHGKITEAHLIKQIQDYSSTTNSTNYMFTIITNQEVPIGRCILFGIDHVNGKGTVGIYIGDKNEWGKGYGREAIELLIEYGFRIQNLHSIMLEVLEFNSRAINMYKKVGFKEIGKRREIRKINGKYVNAILMDILEHEYENKYFDFSLID